MKTIALTELEFEEIFQRSDLGDRDTARVLWSEAEKLDRARKASGTPESHAMRSRLENVAAVSAEIAENDRTGLFYEEFGKAGGGGFLEIWQYAVDIGEAVTRFELQNPDVWHEADWPLTIAALVRDTMHIVTHKGEIPTNHDQRVLEAVKIANADWSGPRAEGMQTRPAFRREPMPEGVKRADIAPIEVADLEIYELSDVPDELFNDEPMRPNSSFKV